MTVHRDKHIPQAQLLFESVHGMFKRVEKRIRKREKEEELGLDGDMKEMLGLNDTDSDESSSSSSEDGSDDEDQEEPRMRGEDASDEDDDEGWIQRLSGVGLAKFFVIRMLDATHSGNG